MMFGTDATLVLAERDNVLLGIEWNALDERRVSYVKCVFNCSIPAIS